MSLIWAIEWDDLALAEQLAQCFVYVIYNECGYIYAGLQIFSWSSGEETIWLVLGLPKWW